MQNLYPLFERNRVLKRNCCGRLETVLLDICKWNMRITETVS